jgi:hypothetical protein
MVMINNGCRRRQFWFVLQLSLLSYSCLISLTVCRQCVLQFVLQCVLQFVFSCRFCLTVVAFVLQLSLLSYSRSGWLVTVKIYKNRQDLIAFLCNRD